MLVTSLRCWWHSLRCWVVNGFVDHFHPFLLEKASGVKILNIKILSATSYNRHQHTVFAKITAALSQSLWHLKIAWHRHYRRKRGQRKAGRPDLQSVHSELSLKKIIFLLSMIFDSTLGRTMNSDGSWNDFSQLNQMLENVYEDIYGEYLPGITPAAYGK